MKIRPSADRQKVIHCPNDVVIVMNEHDIRYFKTPSDVARNTPFLVKARFGFAFEWCKRRFPNARVMFKPN